MSKIELNKKDIESLLPHREPMLLIDKLTNIVPLKSATAIMYVKKMVFMYKVIFLVNQLCPSFNCGGVWPSSCSINRSWN